MSHTEQLHAFHAQEKLVRTMEIELSEARDRLRALESQLGGHIGNPVLERDIQGQHAGVYTEAEYDAARAESRRAMKATKEAQIKQERESLANAEKMRWAAEHPVEHAEREKLAPGVNRADVAPSTLEEGKRAAAKSTDLPPVQPTSVKRTELPASDPIKKQQGEMLEKEQKADESIAKELKTHEQAKQHEAKEPTDPVKQQQAASAKHEKESEEALAKLRTHDVKPEAEAKPKTRTSGGGH